MQSRSIIGQGDTLFFFRRRPSARGPANGSSSSRFSTSAARSPRSSTRTSSCQDPRAARAADPVRRVRRLPAATRRGRSCASPTRSAIRMGWPRTCACSSARGSSAPPWPSSGRCSSTTCRASRATRTSCPACGRRWSCRCVYKTRVIGALNILSRHADAFDRDGHAAARPVRGVSSAGPRERAPVRAGAPSTSRRSRHWPRSAARWRRSSISTSC